MSIFVERPESLQQIEEGKSYVIAASAGTGKTYTLERLILDKIITHDVPIEKILVVTFTRRAAAEMKGRIRGLLEEILSNPKETELRPPKAWEIDKKAIAKIEQALNDFDKATISTIHGFCQEIISDYAFSCERFFDADRVDEKELFQDCFYDILREKLAVDEAYRPWLERALEEGIGLDELAGHLRKIWSREATILPEATLHGPFDGASPDALGKWQIATACWQLFGAEVALRVEEVKKERGLMTYKDLIVTLRDQVVSDSGLAEILRERFKVAMVDEFQDTDPVQWKIFQEIFLAAQLELFVIGDEKQAIYSFRGADVGTYQAATKDPRFGAPINLEQNYRSTKELIDAYNEVFVSGFFAGKYRRVSVPNPCKTKRELKGAIGEEPIEVVHLPEVTAKTKAMPAFVAWTAEKIEELLQCEEYKFEIKEEIRRLLPGDIYVLTRTNRECEQVGKALANKGIPYGFYRRPGLFKTDQALDIIRVLRAIARPSDRSRVKKAMLTPFFAIRLGEIRQYESASNSSRWTPRKQIETWHRKAIRRDFAGLFDDIIQNSGVVRRELLSTDGERRLTNYRHIFDWLLERAAQGHLSMEQFADLLQRTREGTAGDGEEEDSDLQRLETDKSSVQIMTVHKSKGLQAEVVFLVGGLGKRSDKAGWDLQVCTVGKENRQTFAFHGESKDSLPHVWKPHADATAEEAERLNYVAITRAVAKVYLPYLDPNASARVDSGYEVVCDSLDNLCGGDISALNQRPGFEVTRISPADSSTVVPRLVTVDDLNLDTKQVEELVTRPAPTKPGGERTFEELREQQSRVTTSYSGMSDKSGERGPAIEPDHESPLPGSKNSGNVLHNILEHLDYETAADASNHNEWLKKTTRDTTVAALLLEQLEEHKLSPPEEFLDYTAQIIFEALRSPLITDDETFPPLSQVDDDKTAREVSFLLPLPDDDTGWSTKRGYFTGEIDLLFEDDRGRIYFADWKSDTRVNGETYGRETLKIHVEENYRKQVAVYTTALVRMLGITTEEQYEKTFGGFFYLFVRGMKADGSAGQYFERLPWSRVQDLNRELSKAAPKLAIEEWDKANSEQGRG